MGSLCPTLEQCLVPFCRDPPSPQRPAEPPEPQCAGAGLASAQTHTLPRLTDIGVFQQAADAGLTLQLLVV